MTTLILTDVVHYGRYILRRGEDSVVRFAVIRVWSEFVVSF